MAGSSSLSAFISTLLPLLIFNVVCLILFFLLRKRFLRIYEPRTYVGKFQDYQKTPKPDDSGLFTWIKDFWSLPDDYILNHNSIDGYLFLRYFKVVALICVGGTLITWPILFPVNATAPQPDPKNPNTQFDLLSFANAAAEPNRYYAHAFLSLVFFGFVFFVIGRESLFFIYLRQTWLLSPYTASRMSSRTVVFTDVPDEYLNEEKLRSIFPHVKHVWIATDTKELQDMVKDRDKTAMKLEKAEIDLSKATNKQRLKMEKKGQPFDNPVQWADENKRPTHRLKPLIGQKVDTIEWCREHLRQVIPAVEKEQALHWNGQAKTIPAVIIEFETIQSAESAFQQTVFHKPKTFIARTIGSRPNEVVYKNLGKRAWTRSGMYAAATALVVVMIIFWVPFTTFVGVIANIPFLEKKVSFLSWISEIPPQILGIITGLLPAILLAVLMALVPIFLRMIATLVGPVSIGEIEMQVQNWYFAFQVIQVFLVTTFSSGAAATGAAIAESPGDAPKLLAGNLPKASNFYISYFVVYGVGTTAGMLLNIVGLLLFILLKNLLMSTPRKRFNQYMSIAGLGWGATYPKFSCLAIIMLSYSMIAPLVLGFAAVGFGLLYMAFRYNLIYVLDTDNISTQGATYARALKHLFVGVYLNLGCMIGLLAANSGSGPAGAGPLIIEIIVLVITILGHISLNAALKPLIFNLPRNLLAESTRKAATSSQLEQGLGHTNSLGQNNSTISEEHNEKIQNNGVDVTINQAKQQPGFKGLILRILHPSWMPPFAQHLQEPLPDYPVDVRREAYLDEAITSPTPLLWIVHDEMGISAREKEETGKVIGITDQGAFFDEKKGNLQTVWEGQPYQEEDRLVREAPIYQPKIVF